MSREKVIKKFGISRRDEMHGFIFSELGKSFAHDLYNKNDFKNGILVPAYFANKDKATNKEIKL